MRARASSAPLPIAMVAVVVLCTVGLPWPPGPAAVAGTPSGHRPPALGTVVLPAIGFGYAVTSQGPLDASQFATGPPSASAAAGALSSLGTGIETYQRSWQDASGANQVQDLVVRFPTVAGARAFVAAARHALADGEIVSSGPLPSIPGAQRTTYFASTDRAGVGQTITLRVEDYAAVLSFTSSASGNPAPITTGSAERVAKAQDAAMATAAAPGVARARGGGVSAADVGWAVAVAGVLAVAVVATVFGLRRRRPDARRREASESPAGPRL